MNVQLGRSSANGSVRLDTAVGVFASFYNFSESIMFIASVTLLADQHGL